MKPMKFPTGQSGASLVELIVGVAILGAVVMLVLQNQSRIDNQSAKIEAAEITVSEAANLMARVKKDYNVKTSDWLGRLRNLPGSCRPGQNFCSDFTIRRQNANGSDYNLRYQTMCQKIKRTRLLTKARLNFRSAKNRSDATCLNQKVKCKAGTMPVVKLFQGGSNTPTRTWPSPARNVLHKNPKKSPIGVALCLVTPSPTGIRVLVESIYVSRFDKAGDDDDYLTINTKNAYFTEKSTANIQHLP